MVKGMNTPFILGNDFGDQYQLSLLCKEGHTLLKFGDTGHVLKVFSSVNPSLVDEEGKSFNVRVCPPATSTAEKIQAKKFPSKQSNSIAPGLGYKV